MIVYHLKDKFDWKPDWTILSTEIELIIFFNRCFIKKELRYGSSELKIVCLVWVYKRLCTLRYFNNKRIVMFIDYDFIKEIVNGIMLNTSSTERINRRLTNASVYLSIYLLEVHHILG